MKKIVYKVALSLVVFAATAGLVSAQYYDWGQNPASIKWKKIQTDKNSFIFPDNYQRQAFRLINYMDTVAPQIAYGFDKGPMRMPVVFHTQNFSSNGLVVTAPSRMEFIVTPKSSMDAMPWLKQLAVHEYRHSVQYNNVNVGVPKFLSYFLGQTGSITGMAFFPVWALEGDAVMAETQMSSFGRGLQPSFTIEYRALALEGDKNFRIDKYFCGSYKDYMPDHYQLGYQINSYAWSKYGENIWNKIAPYGARRPYNIFTTRAGMKKFYNTTPDNLFRETFDDLNNYWRSLPVEDNSGAIIPTPISSYTTYLSPIYASDGRIYAIKTDLDKTSSIVRVDPNTGEEEILHKTGQVNTGLTYGNGKLWWSEIRSSTFWEQRQNSQVCWYDIGSAKSGVISGERREMYPVGMNEGYAAVEYDYTGRYSIKYGESKLLTLPDTMSVHGLAYDEVTNAFYFIALSDAGMWIGKTGLRSGERFSAVTRPSYSSISNLRASAGKLYFNSIATGKDEAHCYDLATDTEYQLSTSKYGSFEPSASSDGKSFLMTTYTPDGYLLSSQEFSPQAQRIEYAQLPRNIVNPERSGWQVMNIDEYNAPDTVGYTPKKYRKGLHLFRFHSWTPAYFEPDNVLSESEFNIHVGATLMSQNTLSSTFTTLAYRYTDEGSFFSGKINYYGWAPKFEIEAEIGDMNQGLLIPSNIMLRPEDYPNTKLQKHYKIIARTYLPMQLSSGYHIRRLTPMVEFKHDNHKVYYRGSGNLRNGFQRMAFSLQYSDNVRLAYRDFLPKWGYTVRGAVTTNPFGNNVGEIYSAYARVYLPGIAAHHSLMVRGLGQCQDRGDYILRQKELFPRGAKFNITPADYVAGSIDYQFPLCYPDTGISSLLYFRRIRLNLTGDYAKYKNFTTRGKTAKWDDIYSYGAEITFDIVPIRLPASTKTSITFEIHKANTSDSPRVGVSLVMPI